MDTIVKTKYVEKELTWWEETRLITWYVLAATIVAVAVRKLKIKS